MKQRNALAMALAALTLLAGPAAAMEAGRLTVWLPPNQPFPGLDQVARRFTSDTEAKVLIQRPTDCAERFAHVAAAGTGPDILIAGHEELAELAGRGFLARISPSPGFRSSLAGIGWQALSSGTETYGYPLTLESIALIYNKALVRTPPRHFEEIPALDRDLQRHRSRALVWDYRNPSFAFPLRAANGGYAFARRPDGSYDLSDTGIDNPGALAGAEYLQSLVDQGLVPRDLDYATALKTFTDGNAALLIDGPWAWDNLDRRGLDYGVAPLPSLGGEPAWGYVKVTAAAIRAASPNRELAARFLEHYLLTPDGLRTACGDRPPAAVSLKALQQALSEDPRRAAAFEAARRGVPNPTAPAMAAFWTALDEAIARIADGDMPAALALRMARTRLTDDLLSGR